MLFIFQKYDNTDYSKVSNATSKTRFLNENGVKTFKFKPFLAESGV